MTAPTREEVLEGLHSDLETIRNEGIDPQINFPGLLAAIAFLEGPTSRVRKNVVAAEKHGRLWREVTTLVKPHQRKGERVLHALRRLLQ